MLFWYLNPRWIQKWPSEVQNHALSPYKEFILHMAVFSKKTNLLCPWYQLKWNIVPFRCLLCTPIMNYSFTHIFAAYGNPLTGSYGFQGYWLDLWETTESVPGTWIWQWSGQPATYTNWAGERTQAVKRCANVRSNGVKWRDRICERITYVYICERNY